MTAIEEIQEKYESGLIILKAFMEMSDQEIRDKLKSIGGQKLHDRNDLLAEGNSTVSRVITDEKPEVIKVSYYDTIKISPFGIHFVGEHNHNNYTIVEFNDHFKL